MEAADGVEGGHREPGIVDDIEHVDLAQRTDTHALELRIVPDRQVVDVALARKVDVAEVGVEFDLDERRARPARRQAEAQAPPGRPCDAAAARRVGATGGRSAPV